MRKKRTQKQVVKSAPCIWWDMRECICLCSTVRWYIMLLATGWYCTNPENFTTQFDILCSSTSACFYNIFCRCTTFCALLLPIEMFIWTTDRLIWYNIVTLVACAQTYMHAYVRYMKCCDGILFLFFHSCRWYLFHPCFLRRFFKRWNCSVSDSSHSILSGTKPA